MSTLRVLHTLAVSLELDFGAESYVVIGLNGSRFCADAGAAVGESGRGRRRRICCWFPSPDRLLDDDVPYEGLCLLVELLSELSGSARAGG